jgi:hypothetical protein
MHLLKRLAASLLVTLSLCSCAIAQWNPPITYSTNTGKLGVEWATLWTNFNVAQFETNSTGQLQLKLSVLTLATNAQGYAVVSGLTFGLTNAASIYTNTSSDFVFSYTNGVAVSVAGASTVNVQWPSTSGQLSLVSQVEERYRPYADNKWISNDATMEGDDTEEATMGEFSLLNGSRIMLDWSSPRNFRRTMESNGVFCSPYLVDVEASVRSLITTTVLPTNVTINPYRHFLLSGTNTMLDWSSRPIMRAYLARVGVWVAWTNAVPTTSSDTGALRSMCTDSNIVYVNDTGTNWIRFIGEQF